MSFPNLFISVFSLTVLLRVSSISVFGTVVHESMDGAAVNLLDLEKVLINKFKLFLGAVIIYEKWAFKDRSGRIAAVV